MKQLGILLFFAGVALMLLSAFLSFGYQPNAGMGNLERMQVVFKKGKIVTGLGYRAETHEGRIAYPLKHVLAASGAMIVIGTGAVWLSRK